MFFHSTRAVALIRGRIGAEIALTYPAFAARVLGVEAA
jgi:hypothetical protein